MRNINGDYGCMGDLGIHTQHLPFHLGIRPRTVSAQLANLVPQRPGPDGTPVPCETWDNAILLCEAENAAGDRFPMQMEMKRMAPGCTNTVEYEIYGLNMSARFTTDDPNAVRYTQAVGRSRHGRGWWWGKRRSIRSSLGASSSSGSRIRCCRCSPHM